MKVGASASEGNPVWHYFACECTQSIGNVFIDPANKIPQCIGTLNIFAPPPPNTPLFFLAQPSLKWLRRERKTDRLSPYLRRGMLAGQVP